MLEVFNELERANVRREMALHRERIVKAKLRVASAKRKVDELEVSATIGERTVVAEILSLRDVPPTGDPATFIRDRSGNVLGVVQGDDVRRWASGEVSVPGSVIPPGIRPPKV